MKKLDLKKELKDLYGPSAKEVELVRVPPFKYLMVDGAGDPNGEDFRLATEAMYGTAYTLKFKLKKELQVDYPVMALEGLWSMPGERRFDQSARNEWLWTLMMVQPSVVTASAFTSAVKTMNAKKQNPFIGTLRLEKFTEGLSIQVMHVGPYADEPATLERMDEFAVAHRLQMHGKHHEIYLSDPRRVKPEKMKTILRHPVQRRRS